MDASAVERMEEFARGVLKLTPEMQTVFFNDMVHNGMMSAEEAEGLKQYVALYHMFTDYRYYNAVRTATMELYLIDINKKAEA